MKNLKKVLAFVTMLTMLLSVAVSAGTLYPDVADDASYAEAVETLNALGIMIGDEQGNFNPDASITRAETAAIVTRMKALVATAGGTNFTDVAADHWAAGYINCAEQSGIINGYGDGTFGPSNPVTFEQVIKMIVAALGRTPEAESLGGYPSGYSVVAARENITKGVSVTPGAEAPRAAVARLVFNALEVPIMEQTGYTPGEEEYTIRDGSNNTAVKTLLKNALKVNKVEGIVEGSYLTAATVDPEDDKIYLGGNLKIDGYVSTSDKYDDTIEDAVEAGLAEGKTNAAALLGHWVSAYIAVDDDTDEWTLLGIAKKSGKNEVLTIDYSQIDDVAADYSSIEYFKNENDSRATKIDIATGSNVAYYYNNGYDNGEVEEFLDDVVTNNIFGELTLIDNNNDDVYDVVMLKQATANYVVGEVNASAKSLADKDGNNIDIDVDDENVITKFYKADGTAASFEDIAEDNVLTLYNNRDESVVTVYISDAKVEGTVKEQIPNSDNDDAYVIGDGTYKIAYIGGSPVESVNVGDEGTFYINVEGRIVDKKATAASGNYAYLYKALETSNIEGATVELKYLTTDGVWETKNLANKVTIVIDGVSSTVTIDNATEDDFKPFLKKETEEGPNKDKLVEGDDADSRVFQYTTNSAGNINKLYIVDTAENDDEVFSLDKTVANRDYDADQKKIGSLYFNDETKVFSVPTDIANADEDDITLTKVSSLFVDGSNYADVRGYDIENNIPGIVVAYDASADILAGTKLLVVTKISDINNANGVAIQKIYGLQEGQEVSGETAEDLTITDMKGVAYVDGNGKDKALAVGDVVIFSLDANGNIDKVQVLMSLAAAEKAIEVDNGGAFSYTDEAAMTADIFGFVTKKANSRMYLAQGLGKAALLDDVNRDEVSIPTNASNVNVYEININRSTPSFQVLNFAKIDAENRYGKDAHWAYVRQYDDAVVDVVVYRTTNMEQVATPSVTKVEAGKVTASCATKDATIMISINDEAAVELTADVTVVEGDKVVLTATKAGMAASAESDVYTVTADDVKVAE